MIGQLRRLCIMLATSEEGTQHPQEALLLGLYAFAALTTVSSLGDVISTPFTEAAKLSTPQLATDVVEMAT